MELILIACNVRNEELENEIAELVKTYKGLTDWNQTEIQRDDIEIAKWFRLIALASSSGTYVCRVHQPESKPKV
jgi:hypothetical protein